MRKERDLAPRAVPWGGSQRREAPVCVWARFRFSPPACPSARFHPPLGPLRPAAAGLGTCPAPGWPHSGRVWRRPQPSTFSGWPAVPREPDAAVRLTCPPRETLPAHARPAVVSPDARVQGALLATSGGRVRTQLRRPVKDWEEAPGSVLRRLASGRAVGRRAPPSSRCLGSRGETCHIVLSTCSQNRH